MINNVVLVGRLTKDADLKYTANGAAVATFTLAVNRAFTNQSGEREADFVNCVIWRKSAETLANFTRKGSLIGVVGRIQTRNYDNQQGQRVYVTEVVCESFQMLEKKSDSSNSSTQQSSTDYSDQFNPEFGKTPPTNDNNTFGGNTHIEVSDDDLPF